MRLSLPSVASISLLVVVGSACGGPEAPPAPEAEAPQPAFTLPRGLESNPIEVPEDNPMTAERIALGEMLFFDKRLSRTQQMSCETCHVPEQGWTDHLPLSPRFDGSMNTRHTPTLYGAAYYREFYWDGRSPTLEAQILAAWEGQMGGRPDEVAAELAAVDGYATAFQEAFGGPPTGDDVVKALASFVRTIHAGDTEWDRHPQDRASLEATPIGRGFIVFSDVANCTNCHLPPLFTDTLFHNVGVGFDQPNPDMGRGGFLAARAGQAGEPVPEEARRLMGAFKTPTLRGIALTHPYFHDGHAETLEDAVDFMLKGGIPNDNLDELLQPAELTPEQREDLLAFLRALTPPQREYPRPTLP